MYVGELIQAYRRETNLSMDEFARLTGLSKPYISMLEKNRNSRTGKPIVPSIATLQKVAQALHLSFEQLMHRLDDTESDSAEPVHPDSGAVLTVDERIILALYRQLERDDKIEIRGEIKGMLKAKKRRSKVDAEKENTL